MIRRELIEKLMVEPGKKVRLKDYETGWKQNDELKELGKEFVKARAKEALEKSLEALAEAQDMLYADDRFSVLVILQAMDAAGKDGTIKHVMSGVNPQGCQVYSFKQPSLEELDHNFLWRHMRCLPERGRIGIFNRSYYEDVLVVKVHPEYLGRGVTDGKIGKKFWEGRYEDINAFERHLHRNGTRLLKLFLNVSKDEQKKRFLERLDRPEKHWKFSPSDLAERAHWDEYMDAYQDALEATSTAWAPWHIIPADDKWATRAIVADMLSHTVRSLDPQYPVVTDEHRRRLAEARVKLEQE